MKRIIFLFFLAGLVSVSWAQTHKEYPPTVYPDRVILGWQEAPATSQSVNWRTDSTVTNAVGAITEADPSPELEKKSTLGPASTQRIKLDGTTKLYHTVHFNNLKPATKYNYRVGN